MNYITKMTYDYALKRLMGTDTIDKLKKLAKSKDLSLGGYLKYVINELYELKFHSNVIPQMGDKI